jgi:Ca2+:H+ antiporter
MSMAHVVTAPGHHRSNLRALLAKHWMLVFVPLAVWIEHVEDASDPLIFLIAALAIVPVARFIGESTHQLAHYTGESIGGLLNATFGNLPELIICIVALKAGLYEMVAASLIGAILFNLLLVLGLSFFLGGLKQHTLAFNPQAARVYSSLMFVAVLSLALPSIYTHAFGESAPESTARVNLGMAFILIALYGLYLVFLTRTHTDVFASATTAEEEEHQSHWSLTQCLTVLIVASVGAAFLSEILVGAAEGTGESLGLSAPFLGIVLLASVGGIAEGLSAISVARKGRADLALSITLGSCILIALLVSPALVFISYFVGPHPFSLTFSGVGVSLLLLVVLIGSIVGAGGSGNWYKGVQLIAVYVMIALLLYFIPTQS